MRTISILLLSFVLCSSALAQPVFTRSGTGAFTDVTASGTIQTTGTIKGLTAPNLPKAVSRSLAEHFADTINIRDFGAVCDGTTDDSGAIQQAFAAAATAGYSKVVVPKGICLVATGITQTLGAYQGITLEGSTASTLLFPAGVNGPSITLAAPSAGFSANNLQFVREGDNGGAVGTGLTIQAAPGVANGIMTHLSNLTFRGINRTDTWNVGLALTSLDDPTLDGILVQQPDASSQSTGPTGLIITGLSNQQYAIDTKISNSTFQGGHINIYLAGSVQGVFITNSEGIGSDYGVYGIDDGTHSTELVTVNNSHWNNTTAGVYLTAWNENSISNNLFLHFNPSSSGNYTAISLLNSAYDTVTANTLNGGGVGYETFEHATNGQFHIVMGNDVVYINGPCFDLGTGVQNATVTGNACSGVSVSTPAILPSGSGIALSANLYNSVVGDFGVDGAKNARVSASALFTPQIILDNAGSGNISFRDSAGTLHTALSGATDGSLALGSGSTAATFGTSNESLGFFGHATALQPKVTGTRTTNATINQILTALSTIGLVADNSTQSDDFSSDGNLFAGANIYPGTGAALILSDSGGSAGYLSPDASGGINVGSLKSGGVARITTPQLIATQQLSLPTVNAVPSTTTPAITGTTPIVVDTTDSKLCALIGSTWKCSTLQ